MSKRFTETGKWDDVWFRELSPAMKCAWLYICDRCDASGVWSVDAKAMEFHVGEKIPLAKVIEAFGDRIEPVDSRSGPAWRVIKFVLFQFPNLSRDCKPHKPVFNAIERNKLDENSVRLGEASPKVIDTLPLGFQSLLVKEKEKEKEEDKVKDTEKEVAIPAALNTAEFVETWTTWVAYRKEIGQKLKPTTVKIQLAKMQEWGPAESIEKMKQSMAQGWTGIFELKTNGQAQKKSGGTSTYELEAKAHGYTL
jgi:hypothetical protein